MTETFEPSYPMARTAPFDPPPAYDVIRDEAGLPRVKLWDGTEPYLLTRYEDIRQVLSDATFSCEPNRPGFPHVFEGRMVADKADRSFLRIDNPEHDRLRRMVTKEFTVKRVNALRRRIQEVVDRLIENYIKLPKGADFVEHFSGPLPTEIITFLLGIPYDDHEFFHEATRIQFGTKSTPAEVRKSLDELFDYINGLIDRKARDPQDDIVSRLISEQYEQGHLDRETLINIIRLLLSAGHQTTQNMTALGVLTLLQHPDQLVIAQPRDVRDGGLGQRRERRAGRQHVRRRSLSKPGTGPAPRGRQRNRPARDPAREPRQLAQARAQK